MINFQDRTPNMDDGKTEAKSDFERNLKTMGCLSDEEIKRYSDFEFEMGPTTLDEQIDRYYLMIKNGNPDAANKLIAEIGEIDESTLDVVGIQNLCLTLNKYISGIIIRINGKTYTVVKNQVKEI